jgi:hypothetical protein
VIVSTHVSLASLLPPHRLATNAYQHPDKKCRRYEEPGYSAARFDVTELAATLLEVCAPLYPNTCTCTAFCTGCGCAAVVKLLSDTCPLLTFSRCCGIN